VQAFLRLLERGEIRGHKMPEGVDLGEHAPSRAPRPAKKPRQHVQMIAGRRMKVVATSLELDEAEDELMATTDDRHFSR
jgi:hypothetical protein